MHEWHRQIQKIVDEIDECIKSRGDEAITLERLSRKLGYSEYYVSRKFREVAGMQFREYLRCRKMAFALKEVRDTDRSLLEIALDYGFSSNEAFTRAFGEIYGVVPGEYRKHPTPVSMRTIIRPFDCWVLSNTEGGAAMNKTENEIKTYFVTIPAHKYLHIRNYESIGYWDFWQKQAAIPGQDCDTICGLLDSIQGKLDDLGGAGADAGSGQLMAFINEPTGRICSWGIPLAESYGVRLAEDYQGPVPEQMLLMDVPEGEYIVFEHGPFDFETQNRSVEAKIEEAMKTFDYEASGYKLDTAPGRVFYFYHDCTRYWKYVRPVCKKTS